MSPGSILKRSGMCLKKILISRLQNSRAVFVADLVQKRALLIPRLDCRCDEVSASAESSTRWIQDRIEYSYNQDTVTTHTHTTKINISRYRRRISKYEIATTPYHQARITQRGPGKHRMRLRESRAQNPQAYHIVHGERPTSMAENTTTQSVQLVLIWYEYDSTRSSNKSANCFNTRTNGRFIGNMWPARWHAQKVCVVLNSNSTVVLSVTCILQHKFVDTMITHAKLHSCINSNVSYNSSESFLRAAFQVGLTDSTQLSCLPTVHWAKLLWLHVHPSDEGRDERCGWAKAQQRD